MTDLAGDAQLFEPLFRGAARLGLLLGAMDLPWEKVAPVVALFPAELRDEWELAVAETGPPLWLRTRGDGKDMTFRIARFMEQRGVPEAQLRRLLVTAEHAGHQHLLFELGVDATGPAAFSWILRQPLPLPEVRAWLAAVGADTDALARVGLVAEALDKPHAHGLGEQVEGAATQLVAFSCPVEGDTWARLELAATRAGVDPQTWARLEPLMPQLAERETRVVIELRSGSIVAVRLDIDGVLVTTAAALGSGTWSDRVSLLGEAAQRERLHRVSFRLANGQPLFRTAWSTMALTSN